MDANQPRFRWSDLRDFVGSRTLVLMGASLILSLGLFSIELGVAKYLRVLLEALGITPSGPRGSLESIFLILSALVLLRGVISGGLQWCGAVTSENFRYRQRVRLVDWLFSQRQVNTSRYLIMFNERVIRSMNFLDRFQSSAVQLTLAILLLAGLLVLLPTVTLWIVLTLAVLNVPLRRYLAFVHQSSMNLMQFWTQASRRILMGVRGLLLLRIYGLEKVEARSQRGALARHHLDSLRYRGYSALASTLGQIVAAFILLIIAFAASHVNGAPKGGILVSYFYLLNRFLQQLISLNNSYSSLVFERPHFLELLSWWSEARKPESITTVRIESSPVFPKSFERPFGWKLEGLSFSYPESNQEIFGGLDWKIRAGSINLLVGASGIGKTTLLHLLLGELEPRAGLVEVELESQSFKVGAVREDLLRKVGYVGPESFMFDGSLRENLLLGVEGSRSDDEILEALEASGCEFLKSLHRGLDHRLSDQGAGLSAGQKQRLALARALLRKPKALILDEPTSNLDLATEDRLIDQLASLRDKITIVVASHRLAFRRLNPCELDLEQRRREWKP